MAPTQTPELTKPEKAVPQESPNAKRRKLRAEQAYRKVVSSEKAVKLNSRGK